jgi:transposase
MRKVYVGLDVGSRGCEVAAMDEAGVILERHTLMTSEKNLIKVFEAMKGEIHVHLEASELAGWVRRVIKPIVTRVVISHPKSNQWIGRDPLKNDRIDATKLAEMLRTGKPHEVYYADDDGRSEFKRLVQHYDHVTTEEARLKRAIKGRLRAQGVIVKDLSIFTSKGRSQVLKRVTCTVARASIEQLYDLLGAALKTQRAALGLMRKESERYPEIALFVDVPGIGVILACRFSAYLQTPHRFANKRKVWRYCRLGIAWRKSDGQPLNHQALDRNGCGALKDLSRKAFMASLTTKKENAFKRTYLASWKNTGDKTHARLTVQRKIVATLWTMWRKGEKYIDSSTG